MTVCSFHPSAVREAALLVAFIYITLFSALEQTHYTLVVGLHIYDTVIILASQSSGTV